MEPRTSDIPPPKLISTLRSFDLLPAIVFLPTRRKCDEAAAAVAADRSQKNDPERQRRRAEIFERFVVENPEVSDHKHWKLLVNGGVAAHHAGHIPAWKMLIEQMMSAGLLNALFATSTVAAGVDFPARTVVVGNADTRGNDGWRPLTVNELQQMTGRAGRRGRDKVGFVVLVPGQFQNPKRIAELLKRPPDKLESRFRSTYTSLLNLLDAFASFAELREVAEKSFANFDATRAARVDEHTLTIWDTFENKARVLDHFGYIDREAEMVTESGKWLADLRVDRPLIVGEALRQGLFDGLGAPQAAGLIAAVAADAERSYGLMHASRKMDATLTELEELSVEIANIEWRNGVDPVEEINYSAAAAAERWAAGMPWDEIVERTRAEEGDLFRLFSRTGEALRQAAYVAAEPSSRAVISSAVEAVLREPVRW